MPYLFWMKSSCTLHFWLAWLVSVPAAWAQRPALSTFTVGTGAAQATVTVSQLTTGPNLAIPWELVWGPDNFIWMTERYGRISRVDPTTGQVLPLLTLPDVTLNGEGGLLGLTLHPQFSTSPYVYIVYTHTNAGLVQAKVVRYTYTAATTSLSNPTVLLAGTPTAVWHNGSRLIILADGTLLLTTGDALQPGTAQDPATRNGKTLRINLDGTIPADNPIPGSPVFTVGHRNPQGLMQLPNGRIYSAEHGNSAHDEINIIEAGRNYGWPNVEGFCDQPAELLYCAANNIREPLIDWAVAPAALAYYDHPAIPAWRGGLLQAALGGNRLTHLALNASGTAITAQSTFLTTYGRLRALCVSPEGRVYVGTSNAGGQPGTPGPSDDRILVLENRAFVSTTRPGALEASFAVWPTPACGAAQVVLPTGGATLTVCDLTGRPVRNLQANTTTATLSLTGLAPGLYLVQAQTSAGIATRRMLVE